MAKSKKNNSTKHPIIKNLTIATLVALLFFTWNVQNIAADTIEQNAFASTDVVEQQEPVVIYKDKIVEVEKEVEVPFETIVEVEKIVEKEVEKNINHYYEQVDCVDNGNGTYTVTFSCVECDDSYEVVVGEVHEHNYNVVDIVDATCTTNGKTTYACECGITYANDVEATGHEWTNWTTKTAATTTANEVEGRSCVNCGLVETREVANTMIHVCDFNEVDRKSATCTDNGFVKYACECGETNEEVIYADGHEWTNWTTKTAATTTANEVESRSCVNCGLVETREVANTMIHVCDFNEVDRKSATCTDNGFVKYACECGETNEEVIYADGHEWTDWQSISTLSTFDKIVEVRECLACGDYENRETIIEHVHNYNFVIGSAIAPTCDNAGKEMDQECICGDVITGEEIAALGHDYEVINGTSVEATCESTGKVSDKKCANCGDVITGEEIAALGHNYTVVTDTDATCEENGCHREECSNCGNVIETIENATGHNWSEYVYNNDATELEDGTETRRCEDCGKEETQIANGTKIEVDWRGRTQIEIDELHWGYYTDDNGKLICASKEACKSYLAEKYPFLTVYESETAVWAE